MRGGSNAADGVAVVEGRARLAAVVGRALLEEGGADDPFGRDEDGAALAGQVAEAALDADVAGDAAGGIERVRRVGRFPGGDQGDALDRADHAAGDLDVGAFFEGAGVLEVDFDVEAAAQMDAVEQDDADDGDRHHREERRADAQLAFFVADQAHGRPATPSRRTSTGCA